MKPHSRFRFNALLAPPGYRFCEICREFRDIASFSALGRSSPSSSSSPATTATVSTAAYCNLHDESQKQQLARRELQRVIQTSVCAFFNDMKVLGKHTDPDHKRATVSRSYIIEKLASCGWRFDSTRALVQGPQGETAFRVLPYNPSEPPGRGNLVFCGTDARRILFRRYRVDGIEGYMEAIAALISNGFVVRDV